ncbi:hypothetical protein TNCV_4430981 [Trichonephila clavipes]|nr:hypothetical protein TNCV_4430981 [Trichonephila clavipes]
MRKFCAKMLKTLTIEQNDIRQNKCLDLNISAKEQGFFSRMITSDESSIFECDPETKRQIVLPMKTRYVEEPMRLKSVEAHSSSRWPTHVSPSSLDYGSKLVANSPRAAL